MRIRVLVPFFIALTIMSSAFAQSSGSASAQAFPNRPIRLVVNTSAGSSPDLIARAVGRQAESFFGQNVIVDNRTGANGIIGAVIVAHAAPDGHTVLHCSPGVILNALIHIVNRLHAAVREALKAPKIVDFLDAAAFYPVGSTPEEFRAFVNAELKRYSEAVREAKISLQ